MKLDTTIVTSVPLGGRNLRALIARAVVRHGRILTEGSMTEVPLKDFVAVPLTIVKLQVTPEQVVLLFNTNGDDDLAHFGAFYDGDLWSLLARDADQVDGGPVRFTVPAEGTTVRFLAEHAAGLDLTDPEDRATYRRRVADITGLTRVDRLREFAADMDIADPPPHRYSLVRALADAYIEHANGLLPFGTLVV